MNPLAYASKLARSFYDWLFSHAPLTEPKLLTCAAIGAATFAIYASALGLPMHPGANAVTGVVASDPQGVAIITSRMRFLVTDAAFTGLLREHVGEPVTVDGDILPGKSAAGTPLHVEGVRANLSQEAVAFEPGTDACPAEVSAPADEWSMTAYPKKTPVEIVGYEAQFKRYDYKVEGSVGSAPASGLDLTPARGIVDALEGPLGE